MQYRESAARFVASTQVCIKSVLVEGYVWVWMGWSLGGGPLFLHIEGDNLLGDFQL